DGIRDATVTGVQTCALPILGGVIIGSYPRIFFIEILAGLSFANSLTILLISFSTTAAFSSGMNRLSTRISHVSGMMLPFRPPLKIGRASCREGVDFRGDK